MVPNLLFESASFSIVYQPVFFSHKLGRVRFCYWAAPAQISAFLFSVALWKVRHLVQWRCHHSNRAEPPHLKWPWGAVSMPHNNTWPYNDASIWTQNNITSSISWLFTRLGYKCQKAPWPFPKIKSSFTGWGSATIMLIPNNSALIWKKFSREFPKSLGQWQQPWYNIWHLWVTA